MIWLYFFLCLIITFFQPNYGINPSIRNENKGKTLTTQGEIFQHFLLSDFVTKLNVSFGTTTSPESHTRKHTNISCKTNPKSSNRFKNHTITLLKLGILCSQYFYLTFSSLDKRNVRYHRRE